MDTPHKHSIIARDGVIELNGQLYLQQQDRAQSELQHLSGEKTIAPEVIRRFNQNVDLSAAYCKSAGLPYLHVVYPSKAMAFREDFAAAGVNLVGIFSDAHRRDEVIYPLEQLVGPDDFETYGSHCSDPGYLKIAQIMFRTIGIPIDAYRPIVTAQPRNSDLSNMRGMPAQNVPTIREFEGLKAKVRQFTNVQMLPGNRGIVQYTLNERAPVQKRVLLFGDSYFAGTVPIIAPLFQEVLYLRSPYVMEDVARVLEPDIILTSNTERYLVNVPDKLYDTPYFVRFMQKGVDASKLNLRNREALFAVFAGRESAEFKAWRSQPRLGRAGAKGGAKGRLKGLLGRGKGAGPKGKGRKGQNKAD
ncbi:MAG: hypothetical protein R3D59_13725 [Paracoccaceae bacterium]